MSKICLYSVWRQKERPRCEQLVRGLIAQPRECGKVRSGRGRVDVTGQREEQEEQKEKEKGGGGKGRGGRGAANLESDQLLSLLRATTSVASRRRGGRIEENTFLFGLHSVMTLESGLLIAAIKNRDT